ncbi:DUF397 domain-containing protein [Kitasatospora sp. NPDC052868]|uniref:DUF397 domain-containing protein n=1 Tax=Kitasatospora sp. NPDC052868 TaxID=3364060 RepID=UPI0037C8A654
MGSTSVVEVVMRQLEWQKSSFSDAEGGSTCIELAVGGDLRHLRESDDPDVVVVTDAARLRAFLLAAKAGEFDHLL